MRGYPAGLSATAANVKLVQDRLFDRADDETVEFGDDDPYEGVKAAGRRLASEFEIDEDRATDMVLSFGSENAARRALVQRWLLDEEQLKAA